MGSMYRVFQNIHIFKDTQKCYRSDAYLRKMIKESDARQEVILEHDVLDAPRSNKVYVNTEIHVSGKRTLEAAKNYQGKKVCVLNFANAVNPGGGVVHGAVAQEEAICRCSTLYENISNDTMIKQYYKPHYLLNELFNDDIIYTPGVVVFKEDTLDAKMLPKEEWYSVDVITCAAPDLAGMSLEKEDLINVDGLKKLHIRRIKRILEVAKKNGNEVVILGAFGCGAFCNPPEIVAEAFKEALEEYGKYFETVEFAIYCSSYETQNYRVFKEVFEK